MAQHGSGCAMTQDLEPVFANKAARRDELKDNLLARLVANDRVSDRSVAALSI
jgi:hypothetical protein